MSFRTFLVSVLSLFFGLIFPAYGSVAAIQSQTGEDDTHWLIYWLIFSILTILENILWPVLQWIPLYSEFKVAILAWLVLPQTKGALWVYESLLGPGLRRARTELSKFPALEKALTQFDQTINAPVGARSVSQNAAEISQRKSKLETVTQEVGSAFSGTLSHIASIEDPKLRVNAEKTFDRDLNRLTKLAEAQNKAKKF